MERKKIVGIRYCLKCSDETDHELIYLDKYLKAGRCLLCNQKFDNRGILIRTYYHDYMENVLLKPLLLYKELERSPRGLKKVTVFSKFIFQFIKEPKKEFGNLIQLYKRHDFK